MNHQCAWPLHGRKPRCKRRDTGITIISSNQLVHTCPPHRAPTEQWARNELKRQAAKREIEHRKFCEQVKNFENQFISALPKKIRKIGAFLLDRADLYRLEEEDIRDLLSGKVPTW